VTIEAVAKHLKLSDDTVRRALKALETAGTVAYAGTAAKGRKLYVAVVPDSHEVAPPQTTERGSSE